MATTPVVLVHGGLYEDVDPAVFWTQTGIGAGLRAAGYPVFAVTRPATPRSWEAERDSLAVAISAKTSDPVALVAASNGCSAALRCVVDLPDLVSTLVLCWPATAGVPEIDASVRERIMRVVSSATADRLLAGETIRGLLDVELESVGVPVTIGPSVLEDPYHRRETVEELMRILPDVRVGEPTPPAPDPEFRHYRSRFVAMLASAIG
jgi:pimeloyl-ACP methyl ester carboxylesterase